MEKQTIHKLKRSIFIMLALAVGATSWSCKKESDPPTKLIGTTPKVSIADSRINVSLKDAQGNNLLTSKENRDALFVQRMGSGYPAPSSYDEKQGVLTVVLDEFDSTLGLEAPQSPFIISYRDADLQGFCTYYKVAVPNDLKPYVIGDLLRVKSITIGSEVVTLAEGKDPLKDPIAISLRYAEGRLSVVR